RDGNGNQGDGCVRWNLNAKTGRLTVGDLEGTLRKGRLELDDVDLWPLTVPGAGTRLHVNLEHRGFSGFCGLVLGCSTWHYTLVLNRDGAFVRTSSRLSTAGGSGTGVPFVAAGSYPPDEYGTYEVLGRGRIRLAYADGTVTVETIGIQRDARDRPDPEGEGLVLDDINFYPITDD
ncbi:MAG: hypothetical protein AB7G37_11605, partial [Solirubrobacteraceae bacterium]